MANGGDLVRDLDGWLAPFLAAMGRKTRRAWAPFYLRGLLGPGACKDAWLVGEWRTSGERKYHLSNLAPSTSLRALAAAIKARCCASKRTGSSRGSGAWVTSRAAPGRDDTGTC